MSFTYKDDTIEDKHHRFQKSKAAHCYRMDMAPEKKKKKTRINAKEHLYFYTWRLLFSQNSHLFS